MCIQFYQWMNAKVIWDEEKINTAARFNSKFESGIQIRVQLLIQHQKYFSIDSKIRNKLGEKKNERCVRISIVNLEKYKRGRKLQWTFKMWYNKGYFTWEVCGRLLSWWGRGYCRTGSVHSNCSKSNTQNKNKNWLKFSKKYFLIE